MDRTRAFLATVALLAAMVLLTAGSAGATPIITLGNGTGTITNNNTSNVTYKGNLGSPGPIWDRIPGNGDKYGYIYTELTLNANAQVTFTIDSFSGTGGISDTMIYLYQETSFNPNAPTTNLVGSSPWMGSSPVVINLNANTPYWLALTTYQPEIVGSIVSTITAANVTAVPLPAAFLLLGPVLPGVIIAARKRIGRRG